MADDTLISESSQSSLFNTIDNVVRSLPRAHELAELEVSETASQVIVQSGNVLTFRRNKLSSEEQERLLKLLDD